MVGGQRRGKFGEFSHSGRVMGKISITDNLLRVWSCNTGSAYVGMWSMAGLLGLPLEY